MNLKEKIRTVPHWPIKGVMFRDITTLLQDGRAFKETCDMLYNRYRDMQIEKVVAMSTDYDCWKEDEHPVSWEEILEVFNQNANRVKKLLVNAVSNIA